MDLHLTLHGRLGLAGQIYRQIRAGIVDGRLAPGERLRSTRNLAARLGVSRKTKFDVFERLIAEGYLCSRAGDGTFVTAKITLHPPPAAAQPALPMPAFGLIWEQLPDTLPAVRSGAPRTYDFEGGVTDKRIFPFDSWRRCVGHALRCRHAGAAAIAMRPASPSCDWRCPAISPSAAPWSASGRTC